MKVLFLDFDGVLVLAGKPSKAAIDNLNYLLEKEPKLKIVISSSWRHKGLEFCKNFLHQNGVDKEKVIGITDLVPSDNRGHHIERYLKENKKIKNFVIFDDIDESEMHNCKKQMVQTNSYVGLTSKDVERAINLLK
jgi:HAD domain in Swiss Army Knife RNA repair proteins